MKRRNEITLLVILACLLGTSGYALMDSRLNDALSIALVLLSVPVLAVILSRLYTLIDEDELVDEAAGMMPKEGKEAMSKSINTSPEKPSPKAKMPRGSKVRFESPLEVQRRVTTVAPTTEPIEEKASSPQAKPGFKRGDYKRKSASLRYSFTGRIRGRERRVAICIGTGLQKQAGLLQEDYCLISYDATSDTGYIRKVEPGVQGRRVKIYRKGSSPVVGTARFDGANLPLTIMPVDLEHLVIEGQGILFAVNRPLEKTGGGVKAVLPEIDEKNYRPGKREHAHDQLGYHTRPVDISPDPSSGGINFYLGKSIAEKMGLKRGDRVFYGNMYVGGRLTGVIKPSDTLGFGAKLSSPSKNIMSFYVQPRRQDLLLLRSPHIRVLEHRIAHLRKSDDELVTVLLFEYPPEEKKASAQAKGEQVHLEFAVQ